MFSNKTEKILKIKSQIRKAFNANKSYSLSLLKSCNSLAAFSKKCEDTIPGRHLRESLEQEIHSIGMLGNARIIPGYLNKGNGNNTIDIVPKREMEVEDESVELVSNVGGKSDILRDNTEALNAPYIISMEGVSNKPISNKIKNGKKKNKKKKKKNKKKKKKKKLTTTTSNESTPQSPDAPLDSDNVEYKSSEMSTIYSFETFDKLQVIFPILTDTSTIVDSDVNVSTTVYGGEFELLYKKYELIAIEKLKATEINHTNLKKIFIDGYFPRSEEILCLQLF